jgi:glutathione synthase/RimK-type ligase-like ATP-grasp enzyme
MMLDLIPEASLPFAPLIGVARLMRRAFLQQDLAPLGAVLLARAQANPFDANALLDCSTVLQLTGERELALAVQAQAIEMQPLYALPALRSSSSAGPGLRLLAIMGPGDLMANTPIEFLVEDADVALDMLYLTLDAPLPELVPDHDVMLVAVAESDANAALLARLSDIVADWPRPVVNLPENIALLSRDGVCAALRDVAGLDMPVTVRLDRAQLQALALGAVTPDALLPGDDFPLIVRPIGSHAGTNLEKIGDGAALAAYLEQVAGERFYLSRFVDYRSLDGLFRKYRIALIDGKPYLCHFAVSKHWMIHYLNAGMTESGEKRAEEAACMANFDQQFALRHAPALQAIHERMGLQYVGIDCAETVAGDLLIFEVDNAMVVHAMDDEAMFPYKKPAMQKVFSALRRMLARAAATPLPPSISTRASTS